MSEESEYDYGEDILEEEELCDYTEEQCIGDPMFCEECELLRGIIEKKKPQDANPFSLAVPLSKIFAAA